MARKCSPWASAVFSIGATGKALDGGALAEEPLVGASPASATLATGVPTSTVSPSFTRISASVPAAGAGTSVSTLSVVISNSGSSRATASPARFSHLTIVPSAIDSPIWGMTTEIMTE